MPPDGHCLLHAVSISMVSQLEVSDTSVDILLKLLEEETINNIEHYKAFVVNDYKDKVLQDMFSYINHRVYNTYFGDLVPLILCNALKVNLLKITKNNDKFTTQMIYADCVEKEIDSVVCVYKYGDHYDALMKCIADNTANEVAIDSSQQLGPIHPSDMPGGNVHSKSIDICFWNINGLTQNKLDDYLLGKFLKSYDIILIAETWAEKDDEFYLNGFTYMNYPRGYKNTRAKRCSGGLGIFTRNEIISGVETYKNHEDIIFSGYKKIFILLIYT